MLAMNRNNEWDVVHNLSSSWGVNLQSILETSIPSLFWHSVLKVKCAKVKEADSRSSINDDSLGMPSSGDVAFPFWLIRSERLSLKRRELKGREENARSRADIPASLGRFLPRDTWRPSILSLHQPSSQVCDIVNFCGCFYLTCPKALLSFWAIWCDDLLFQVMRERKASG